MNDNSSPVDLADKDGNAATATPEAALRRHIMDATVPKNEAEWWAKREIERLRALIADERIACAKIADEHATAIDAGDDDGEALISIAESIADAIRHRPIVTY